MGVCGLFWFSGVTCGSLVMTRLGIDSLALCGHLFVVKSVAKGMLWAILVAFAAWLGCDSE